MTRFIMVQLLNLLAENKDQWFTIEAIIEGVTEAWGEFPREEFEQALTTSIEYGEIAINRKTGNPIYRITAHGLNRWGS